MSVETMTPKETTVAEPTSLLRHYLSIPLREKIDMAIKLLRGVFLWPKLQRRAWIAAGPGVKMACQNGEIHINRFAILRDGVQISVRGREKPAVLKIGYNTRISARTKINCGDSITIGDRCSIGWDCDIMDDSFHVIHYEDGIERPVTAPIVIEDNVWIASNSIVLKGVTIGHHSVIAAGAVVVSNIPPYSLVGGNPAKVIKKIKGWSRKPVQPASIL